MCLRERVGLWVNVQISGLQTGLRDAPPFLLFYISGFNITRNIKKSHSEADKNQLIPYFLTNIFQQVEISRSKLLYSYYIISENSRHRGQKPLW